MKQSRMWGAGKRGSQLSPRLRQLRRYLIWSRRSGSLTEGKKELIQ